MPDSIDWADLSAMLAESRYLTDDHDRPHWYHVAAALREAYEAGRTEEVTRQTLALLDGIKLRGVASPTTQDPR